MTIWIQWEPNGCQESSRSAREEHWLSHIIFIAIIITMGAHIRVPHLTLASFASPSLASLVIVSFAYKEQTRRRVSDLFIYLSKYDVYNMMEHTFIPSLSDDIVQHYIIPKLVEPILVVEPCHRPS